jgi:hypothetical protein
LDAASRRRDRRGVLRRQACSQLRRIKERADWALFRRWKIEQAAARSRGRSAHCCKELWRIEQRAEGKATHGKLLQARIGEVHGISCCLVTRKGSRDAARMR